MWKLTLLIVSIAIMASQATGASTGSYAGGGVSAGGFAGGYAGGYGGGYGGYGGYAGTAGTDSDTDVDDGFVATSFDTNINNDADYGDYDSTGLLYAPDFGLSAGFIDPFVFHQQLTAQIQAQHAAQQNVLVKTFSTEGTSVTAEASNLPNDNLIQRQIAAQHAYFDAARRRNHYKYRGSSGKPSRYAPNYAAASGSIGPGGHFQTAYISPANPASPNVVNRFSTSSTPGGFKGVSVSSYSSSADVNGKRYGVRGAQTTVNDNGKVTTYSTHS